MSIYNARPYHADCLSDDGQEDDDICMWPELPDICDSEEEWETNYKVDPSPTRATTGVEAQTCDNGVAYEREKVDNSDNHTAKASANDSGKLIDGQFEERQIQSALSMAHMNLARMSQLVLKLEYRTGKVTKEGIRQTLDATVAENRSFSPSDDPTHLEEIEEIKLLTQNAWKRMYLIDRHWSRQSYAARDAQGGSPSLQLRSEPSIKAMLKEDMRMNNLACDDTSYFTVADLSNGRRFKDWVVYLRDLCEFSDDPTDETKLVELAWLFLDRALRGPRPLASTNIKDFVAELEDKLTRGIFADALRNPQNQQKDDKQAWKVIKKRWS
ncbi:hypothetical protein F4820DRAFT_465966 [Hypoxylon rubiginosum]|uniref:Uncharacterized protein n=1 Tax=Hypoxylon rubiginosum TaxID=110542 RepID=A0ACB9YL60_9PEZI|nr:hypothetical protein F4820DRAFT_465966 [Hypoxylon rubiginosum]